MNPSILSTRRLMLSQKELLLNAGFRLVEYDAISIEFLGFKAPKVIENAIFTSQNGVRAYFKAKTPQMILKNCFCVGEKTMALLDKNGQKVIKMAKNGEELANFLVNHHKNESFIYFCGSIRREKLPNVLKSQKMDLFEVKTYKTVLNPKYFDQKWDGILFFSPSGVESYISGQKNGQIHGKTTSFDDETTISFCIGETTASEARKYMSQVVVSNSQTVESVIAKAAKTLKESI